MFFLNTQQNSKDRHTRYFQMAQISIEVKSDLPITDRTFAAKFKPFEAQVPLKDHIVIRHRFSNNFSHGFDPKDRVYFKAPWAVYNTGEQWAYQWINHDPPHDNYFRTVLTDREHTFLDIYNDHRMKEKFIQGGLTSLTMFPTDQILMGRILAYRNGCIIHSLGISLDNRGLLFVGHSDAGKSTMAGMMKKGATILCDDRNIVRLTQEGYTLSGTWSHGDVPDVSSKTVPLKAILFLNQSDTNRLEPVTDDYESFERLLACLIRPLKTPDWWDRSLRFLSDLCQAAPCYHIQFDKTGKVFDLIKAHF